VAEIEAGQCNAELAELKSLDVEALKERYKARDIEAE
jgi:hypothetical protein